MALSVSRAARFRARTRVLIHYHGRNVTWPERVLLASIGDGQWVMLNPDLDLETRRLDGVVEPDGVDKSYAVPAGGGRPPSLPTDARVRSFKWAVPEAAMDTFVDNVEDEAADLRHKAFVVLRKVVAATTKTGTKPAPAGAGVGLDDEPGDPGDGGDTPRGDAPLPAPKLPPSSKKWAHET